MAFQVSPGVNVSEVDLTTIVPAVSTSVAGIALPAVWGPVEEITTITSEEELESIFGKPNSNTAVQWLSAANFLQYANHLKAVRTNLAGSYNASSNAINSTFHGDQKLKRVQVKTRRDYDDGVTAGSGTFIAKFPGALGNSLKVIVFDSNEAFNTDASKTSEGGIDTYTGQGADGGVGATGIHANSIFDGPPGTSSWANSFGHVDGTSDGVKDELHVLVIDEDGLITGTKNTILEKYQYLSKSIQGQHEDGSGSYWRDEINATSPYIWVNSAGQVYQDNITLANNGTMPTPTLGVANVGTGYGVSYAGKDPRATTTWGLDARELIANGTPFETHHVPLAYSLVGGNDGTASATSSAEWQSAYAKFIDADEVDVSMLIAGELDVTDQKYVIQSVAEKRKDCLAFISPDKADVQGRATDSLVLTEVLAHRAGHVDSSYATMDSGWKYQFDRYNNMYRWVPLNADIAGLCARTDYQRDAWWSPAGFNRGQLKNVVRLAWNPKKAHRDDLYRKGINPVVTFPGQGTVLFGDKTLQSKPSAFDRINVRRLFIVLEKAISTASKFSLFEFNDEFTRAQFRNMVEPFLRDIQGRRGVTDFRVVCDETNNTPGVIDRNEFVGDIYIKPNRSINFIQLNFVALRTGVDFAEIVGQF